MINQGLTEEWPPEVVAAMGGFEQGDLVEQPPFFYVGSARHGVWQLTRELGDPDLPDELFELDPEVSPPYGMITTETCDLMEQDGRPRNPWISIAPVYEASTLLNDNLVDLLDRGKISYLYRVHCEALPDGIWVGDVRIEMPVEKSWLVGRVPIRMCKDDGDHAMLAGFLASRRDRPVLSKALHSALITHMRRWIEKMPVVRRAVALDGIAEVRLTVAGSPLDPDGVGLLVISDKEPVPEHTKMEWDDKWETWRNRLHAVDIALLGNGYKTYDSLTAREYRESFQIPLDLAA